MGCGSDGWASERFLCQNCAHSHTKMFLYTIVPPNIVLRLVTLSFDTQYYLVKNLCRYLSIKPNLLKLCFLFTSCLSSHVLAVTEPILSSFYGILDIKNKLYYFDCVFLMSRLLRNI